MRSRNRREKARPEPVPPPEGMTRLTLWFRGDEMAALRALAAKEKRSETALVREAVRRLLGLTKREG